VPPVKYEEGFYIPEDGVLHLKELLTSRMNPAESGSLLPISSYTSKDNLS
jgi:hypothetical protein